MHLPRATGPDRCPREAPAGSPHTEGRGSHGSSGGGAQRGRVRDTASSLREELEVSLRSVKRSAASRRSWRSVCQSVTPVVSRLRLAGLQRPSRGCPGGPVVSGCPRQ